MKKTGQAYQACPVFGERPVRWVYLNETSTSAINRPPTRG
jgi:hypothetical protein